MNLELSLLALSFHDIRKEAVLTFEKWWVQSPLHVCLGLVFEVLEGDCMVKMRLSTLGTTGD